MKLLEAIVISSTAKVVWFHEALASVLFLWEGESTSEQQMPEWSETGPATDGIESAGSRSSRNSSSATSHHPSSLPSSLLPYHVPAGGPGTGCRAGHVPSLKVLQVRLDVDLSSLVQ